MFVHKRQQRSSCCRARLGVLLLALFPLAVRCQTNRNEEHILSRFYDVSGGPKWVNNSGWKDANVPVCSWYGITCLGTLGVANISLASNNLVGRVAKLIYTLPQLRHVDLQKNPGITNGGFDGFDPVHAQKFLQVIQLSECSITSLDGLENAPASLIELHLTGNQMKSTFPSEVLNLTNLEVLQLSFNKIKGTVPTEIGTLTNLKRLFLYQTALTGQIPTEVGKLTRLEVFSLAENALSGPLPTELNQLANLQTLSFHNKNDNAGSLDGPLLDFSGTPLLSELYLDGNDLTGSIPSTFLKNSKVTDSRVTIGLSGNQLTGALPLSLNRFKLLDIDLVGNSISLIPISFCDNHGWMGGLVNSYGCNAILCEVGTYNEYGRQMSKETPCSTCTDSTSNFWGSTTCGGSTPASHPAATNSSSSSSSLDFRVVLVTFYQELQGNQWYNKSGWDQITDFLKKFDVTDIPTAANFTEICSWIGVVCDDSDKIIQISLPNNGLVGTIPTEVGALSTLRELDVSANQAVTIKKKVFWKAIGGSTKLTKLNLADTNVDDFEGIGEASQLQDLTLDGVYFARALPTDLFQLSNLKSLHMQYNVLTGRLPTLIGHLANLEVLNLYDNELEGPIPTEIGRLSKIRILDFSENKFNSSLPTELQLLTGLTQLHLHQTFGALSGPLPSFANFALLNELTLDSNNLSGEIPKTFLQDVEDKNQSMYVGLSFNKLHGIIPSELAKFSDMELLIEGNNFTDIPDEVCKNGRWMEGEVGRVGGCSAIGCPVRTWNIYGKASAFVNVTCDGCPSNPFVGQTFCVGSPNGTSNELTDEVKILNMLYDTTNGPNWTLADSNWTKVGVPICQREGVTCEDKSKNYGVTELNLYDFGLRGSVSSTIFTLPKLRRLRLNNNSLEVDFRGIQNAKNLEVLQLSSTHLHNLGGLGKANSKLSEIHLAYNDLSGSFPSEILELTSVKKLFLQQNQFSGSIPSEVDQMEQLQELWLDGNILSGQIPAELGNLTSLQAISLRENHLSGTIPPELGKLASLTHLDLQSQLSDSKIGGTLPAFESSSQLTFLKLNDNNITGSIPENFMATSKKDVLIYVDLSQNSLTGAIPTSLGKFSDLFLDLAGNMITDLPQTFCNNSKWMDGMVGQLKSCDAILCPPGKVSDVGRETVAGGGCESCATYNSTKKYYGQTKCLSAGESFEREILQFFYVGLNGTGWFDQTNWMSEKSVCTWFGVGCDGTGSVVSLVLDSNNLVSLLKGSHALFHDEASNVLKLPNLQVLDLRGNEVALNLTMIPANSSNLQNLTLSGTNLVSLQGIGQANKLQELHVTDNGLKGKIPGEVFWLTNLKRLYMSFNEFTGTLSGDQLANLSNLEEFYMFGNNITGTIPTEVGNLKALREFIMASNQLNGTIPIQFSSLSQLEQLSLYDQHSKATLTGKIPTFANAPRLWYFDASENALTGSIPDSFLAGSVFRNSTVSIYLSNNLITGTVPSSLSKFSVLDIRLDGNRIESIPSQLCTNSRWMDGAVGRVDSSHSCDAILCHKGSYNSVGRQDTANNTCLPCQSGSPYLGQTSCIDLHSERAILSFLYDNTGGTSWKKQSSWNSQGPICSWEGVLCEDGHNTDNKGVTGLYLAENNMQGTLPPTVWGLPLLRSMNIQNNPNLRVTMEGFSNATNLETLLLNSVKLDTIAGVSSATKLKELHITDCALTGTLPEDLFHLGSTLEGLYLAFNSFYGTLSTKIGLLTNLKELFAYDNDFSGSIPTEIGKMTSLTDMVLAENLLSGTLPSQLSAMPNIQVISLYRRSKPGRKISGNLSSFDEVPHLTDLFLDHNEIQGTIPPNFLTSSVNAQTVILSFNKLTGTIPLQIGFLPDLDLELEGNKISGFDKSFCDKSDWMGGEVGQHGCDAILCPPQHAAEKYGRTLDNNTYVIKCAKCPSTRDARYYGSTTCEGPFDVKSALRDLYDNCNGKNWIDQHLWMSSVDHCSWDGIGCSDGEVISINLSANNLTGTIPEEIFNISSLQYLWLHSNPISFKFPSSILATNLLELRLDNTGLASLKSISTLTSLVTLHLEHNLIQGPFSYELLSLSNLRALYLGDNGITGTFPSNVEQLSYLNTLSLRSNGIEGGLPSFELVRDLTNIDLAHNKFTGSIPSQFFSGLGSFAPLVVDLSGNTLSGTIPSSLSRFHNLTIYLRDNLFDDLPSQLCSNDNWNGGDVGEFGCDAIMCPPKTYSPLGRAHQQTHCVECPDASNYGQSKCTSAGAGLRVQRWTLGCSLLLVVAATMGWRW